MTHPNIVLTKNKLSELLEEIAGYEIDLVEDPTQTHLGNSYINSKLAQCRNFSNRVQYYLQVVKKREKELRYEVRQYELDIELKTQEKLADDPIVRNQPSEGIKKAVAMTSLKEEYENLGRLKLELLDVQETAKIIKLKYDDLNKTNQDIKLQRQLVKDDRAGWESGDGGYQDGSKTPAGMNPPVVKSKIDISDLLDDEKRPADLPKPVDEIHAAQIQAFFSGRSEEPSSKYPKPLKSFPDGRTFEMIGNTGIVNNCSLDNNKPESECQICNGNCPNKHLYPDQSKSASEISYEDLLS